MIVVGLPIIDFLGIKKKKKYIYIYIYIKNDNIKAELKEKNGVTKGP